MMILRKRSPELPRIFRCPWSTVVGTLAIVGCIYLLFSLPSKTLYRFFLWNLLGIAIYFLYSRTRSVLATGTAQDRTA
jgi:APA family basic amino acid/polyamine antiporter